MDDQLDSVDFALAAYRDDGEWQVQDIASPAFESVESLSHALRRLPGDGGAVGTGRGRRGLLRDRPGGRPGDPRAALRHHGRRGVGAGPVGPRLPRPAALRRPEDDDVAPAGDLDLLADLGMHAMDMGVLLDDDDLYPDEMLSEVARAARLRRALRRRRRAHLCMSSTDSGTSRCGSRSPRPAPRWPPTTCPSARSSSTRPVT